MSYKVYCIFNNANDKKYIGRTKRTLEKRLWEHTQPKQKYCRLLAEAIETLGKGNFSIELLEEVENEELSKQLEEAYIKSYNTVHPSGYNLQGGDVNRSHHPDTCERMSKSRLGKPAPTSRKKGVLPDDFGKRVSLAKKGKSNGLTGKKRPGMVHLSCRKPVIVTPINGGDDLTFDSLTEACNNLSLHHANAIKVMNGKRTHTGGYKFRYI